MAAPDLQVIPLKPRMLRVFISYAREDEKIALAAHEAIRLALGPFTEVFMDNALDFGVSFQDEISTRLDDTDLLVVIYSATPKPSHSFTGMELGYFMRVRDQDPSHHWIVPIYLDKPPDTLAGNEGINIGISRSTLDLSTEEYSASLQIDSSHPMVKFLEQFQGIAEKYREASGLPKPDPQDLLGLVQKMQLSIFNQLKMNPDPRSALKPQKQITIRTSDSELSSVQMQLPDDAMLIPVGTGNPMSLFGIANQEISWGNFAQATKKSKFSDSWVDAITSVVTSSLQGELEVDNSQVIVSSDERRAFRVILTTGTRYFNGVREFNVYFVEYLRPKDFGDQDTTLVLKGLELACRFRFLFLEKASEFSHMNIRMAQPPRFLELVRNIERELNLLRRDSIEMGLDRTNVWAEFVDWKDLQKMSEAWHPIEAKIREICASVRATTETSTELPALRDSLADVVDSLETTLHPLNTQLICGLSESLKRCCACP